MTWSLSGMLSLDEADRLSDTVADLDDDFHESYAPVASYFGVPGAGFQVDVFFAEKPPAAEIQFIISSAGLDGWAYNLHEVEKKDWVAESQKILHPIEAGRFFIHGSHNRHAVPEGRIGLEIEAGQAFGTGRHETTFLCLERLEALENEITPRRILDLGTGSGVLAMAAEKIWPDSAILATDIDYVAIEVAEDNLSLNGFGVREAGAAGSGIALAVADGLHQDLVEEDGPFDLVIANILAAPLIALAHDITQTVREGGIILLSGLLTVQVDEVIAPYGSHGFIPVAHHVAGDWSAVTLKKSMTVSLPDLVRLKPPVS